MATVTDMFRASVNNAVVVVVLVAAAAAAAVAVSRQKKNLVCHHCGRIWTVRGAKWGWY